MTRLITVDSTEEKPQEIAYAKLNNDYYVHVSKKKLQMLQKRVLLLVMLQKGI